MTAILAFDGNNRLAVRKLGNKAGLAFTGVDAAMAVQRLESAYDVHSLPRPRFELTAGGRQYKVLLCQITGTPKDSEIECWSIERLESSPSGMAPSLAAMITQLAAHLIEIPYLHLGETDFIYKFRPEKERNSSIYSQDASAAALYQSTLCEAIKEVARKHERTAGKPVELDFGAVRYLIPSHFGFCLGVKNAIERAYETLSGNPKRRVFMLSELIHNPFVNQDLARRGLLYLQTDKGLPITTSGRKGSDAPGEALLWDTLTPEDIVIIPAFGATDADKVRLVRKGIAVYAHDATCMLVEKVWKAAQAYGREGYSIIIHGKHEHEETKATFSNTVRHAPALIVRNMEEAQVLGQIIRLKALPEGLALFEQHFKGRHSTGFNPANDLKRIAIVNQTTLLSNETLAIIEHLRSVYLDTFGDETLVGGSGKRDTLCYATQVNQDALAQALEKELDAAIVIGGTNSSNTYQLYRLAEARLGKKAFFIQSEEAIRSASEVSHFVFPSHANAGKPNTGHIELRSLWTDKQEPLKILITGGASCPDGIIQQVISRINSLIPSDKLHPIEEVLRRIRAE